MTMKQSSNRFYKFGLLAMTLVLLVAGSFVQPVLTRDRDRLGLTDVKPLENAPPMLAFTTVALGGFRGIIANALWIRSVDLEDKGKYFESMQLADWITKLQPRMTQVWTEQAWNMAYNISIKFTDPADRWRWVKAGIELLRDEGLKYNPGDALVYRELAWFFQHKMGQALDGTHMYYKLQWAKTMLSVLGPGRPNWDELTNPQTDEAKARVKRLRDEFKMDPAIMKQVDDEYGPLEWKLPETHAIYWATVGLKYAKDKDKDTLRRVVYQCMDIAFQRGRLIMFDNDNEIYMAPNLAIVDKANQAYLDMMKIDNSRIDQQAGYRNFLRKVVYNFYSHSQLSEAEKWWKKLKENYPNAVKPGISLDDWAIDMVTEDANDKDQNKAISAIEGQITFAYFSLAVGEEETAQTSAKLALAIWTRYMTAVGCLKDPPAEDCPRVALPNLEVMRDIIRDNMLEKDSGLAPGARARLLTALNLPADYVPKANKVRETGHNFGEATEGATTSTNSVDTSTNSVPKEQ